MKMKTHTILIFAVGIALMVGRSAFAQTTPYPPQGGRSEIPPTGKTAQSKSTSIQAPSNKNASAKNASKQHQAGRRGYHGPSHGGGGVGVGIGATIDLGGIGQRRAEPDPFAVSARPPSPRTQEKPEKPKTTTKPHEASKLSDFADVELTGEKAKSEIAPTDPFRDVRLTGEQAKEKH
jgi:hypothetical protein